MIALPERLKALTILHPWPYAITQLGKRIENRTWAPSCLKKGDRFALHGAVPPTEKKADAAQATAVSLIHHQPGGPASEIDNNLYPFWWFQDYVVKPHLGIFALAKYGGTVREHVSPWFHGPVGWLLDEIVVLKEPIAVPGAQGLWDVPDWAAIAIRLEVEAMLHLALVLELSEEERKIPGAPRTQHLASYPDVADVYRKVAEMGRGSFEVTRNDRAVIHRLKAVGGAVYEWQGSDWKLVENS